MAKVLRINAPAFAFYLVFTEIVLLVAAFYVGLYLSWVDFDFGPAQVLAHFPKALLFSSVLIVSMFAFGLYRRDGIFRGSIIVPRLVVAFLCSLAVLSLLFYSFPILVIWRSILAWAMPTAFVAIVTTRLLARGWLDSDLLKRQIAVIGSADQAARIEALQGSPLAGFKCLGYVQVDAERVAVPKDRLFAPTNDLTAMLKAHGVEQLVIASAMRDELPTRDLVDCRLKGIRILDYQAFHSEETGRVDLDYLLPDWFFVDEGFHATILYRWAKRIFDFIFAALLLVFMLPLLVLLGIAVRLDGGGQTLYRQLRIGRGGEIFSLLKFRSMRPDAEDDGQPRWSGEGDERVTIVGRFMRRSRLDELPQLWNILKGEMSFVGPRPERPYFVERLSEAHQYYLDRHAVKPGLTGWAQINFPYGNSGADARRKLEYDLYYIKYGNVLMDLVIMLQTLRVLVWPESARSS